MISDQSFFNCTQCGNCCKGFGGTYLTEKDIEAIAGHLSISIASFKEHYCASSGKRFVLAQQLDGFCIFWDGNCSIHAIKPRMCQQWPFIDSLLKDIGNWRIMSGVCPGMRADVNEGSLLEFVRLRLAQK